MQKMQLSIPQPCHENWQNMTPTEQGRFCNACAKEVVDFSMMTDTEVLNYFTNRSTQNVCGRTLVTQLQRNITMPKEPSKKILWYWNYIVMFFLFFAKGNASKAQGEVKLQVTRTLKENNTNSSTIVNENSNVRTTIKPHLNNSKKIENSKIISSKINNETTHKMDEKVLDTLIVSTNEIKQNNSLVLGKIRVTGSDGEELHQIIKPAVCDEDKTFKVYPNPLQHGDYISLSLVFPKKGLHQLQVVNVNGQTVLFKRIIASAKKLNETILCDAQWASGLYFVNIFDGKNKNINKSSFIVQ